MRHKNSGFTRELNRVRYLLEHARQRILGAWLKRFTAQSSGYSWKCIEEEDQALAFQAQVGDPVSRALSVGFVVVMEGVAVHEVEGVVVDDAR